MGEKIRIFGNIPKASILLASFLFIQGFADSIAEEDIIDTSHKNVVNTLNENVDELPESVQDTAKDLIKDFDEDGKNINFDIKLTNVENKYSYEAISRPKISYLLASFGVSLLPNTWKINISYSGVIAENVINTTKTDGDTTAYNENFKNAGSTYLVDDGEGDLSYIDLYMKPLSTKFGDFGFGYKKIQENREWAFNNGTIYDIQNSTNTGALSFSGNVFIRNETNVDRVYTTYNIPKQDNWFDGFGVSIAYEETNNFQIIDNTSSNRQYIYNPDTVRNIYSIGILKTIDEIDSGFIFKTLTYGVSKNTSEYYDYSVSKKQEYKNDDITTNIEMLYMFRSKNINKLYILFGNYRYENDFGGFNEAKLEIGAQF